MGLRERSAAGQARERQAGRAIVALRPASLPLQPPCPGLVPPAWGISLPPPSPPQSNPTRAALCAPALGLRARSAATMHCQAEVRLPSPGQLKAARRRYKTFMIDEILAKETCDYFGKLSLYSVCPSLIVRPKPLHSCTGKRASRGGGGGRVGPVRFSPSSRPTPADAPSQVLLKRERAAPRPRGSGSKRGDTPESPVLVPSRQRGSIRRKGREKEVLRCESGAVPSRVSDWSPGGQIWPWVLPTVTLQATGRVCGSG